MCACVCVCVCDEGCVCSLDFTCIVLVYFFSPYSAPNSVVYQRFALYNYFIIVIVIKILTYFVSTTD